MTVRILNLVAPLAHKATAMHNTETAARAQAESRAVSPLIGASLRQGDVTSANPRSTRMTTPTNRISTMATRTTSRLSAECALSAASSPASFEALAQAYFDCRKHKRNTPSALAFEQNLERNLFQLHEELQSGTYTPGKAICFVITRPKAREVWAADFRDRIVHHLLYNHIAPRFYASFIADSCACIPGRGTLYAAQRLEAKVRSVTQNWSCPAFYLKMDLANFFVAIDKTVLQGQIAHRVSEPWWRDLANQILWHNPRENFELRGNPALLERVPPHKRLINQNAAYGLPIGNLSSQFFANVYLDALDQFCKHQLKAKHYIRYVDDFVLLHESPQWLNAARERIEAFLIERLNARANPSKTILQPISRGVDFVGQVIKPWHRTTRRRTVREAISKAKTTPADKLLESANSYFGLLRQSTASHHDRAKLANVLRYRGRCVSDTAHQYPPA